MKCQEVARPIFARSFIVTRYYVFYLLSLFLIGCSNDHSEHLGNGQEAQKFTMIREIGTIDSTAAPDFFGYIAGIELDLHDNVLVIDPTIAAIKTFTWSGGYIRTIGEGAGEGPGEFLRPFRLSIAVNGDVFIADINQTRLSKFTFDGAFVSSIPLGMMTGDLAVINDEHIYLTKGFYPVGDRVHLFTWQKGEVASAIPPTEYTKIVSESGLFGSIAVVSDSSIVFARAYPYEVFYCNMDLSIINQWNGNSRELGKPPEPDENDVLRPNGFIRNIVIGKDGNVYIYLSLVSSGASNTRMGVIDIFALDGSYIGRITNSDLGLNTYRYFAVNSRHVMVLGEYAPYPRLLWVDIASFYRNDN